MNASPPPHSHPPPPPHEGMCNNSQSHSNTKNLMLYVTLLLSILVIRMPRISQGYWIAESIKNKSFEDHYTLGKELGRYDDFTFFFQRAINKAHWAYIGHTL